MRRVLPTLALLVALAGCGGGNGAVEGADPPTPVTAAELDRLLTESALPVVVNVWASWCVPCRSEAPLLSSAADRFDGDVRFVMLDVQDAPEAAGEFIAEFYGGAPMEHYADGPGNIPVHLGASRAVPLTLFFAPGGELTTIHYGAIDERTIALQVDELLSR